MISRIMSSKRRKNPTLERMSKMSTDRSKAWYRNRDVKKKRKSCMPSL